MSVRLSALYTACRSGDEKEVERLLQKLSVNDLNRLEQNGSTSLHAASYYNHLNIVRLLLDAGASRTIKNKFDLTPYEEAASESIKGLFIRAENAAKLRYTSDTSDQEPQWVLPGGRMATYCHRVHQQNYHDNVQDAAKSIQESPEFKDTIKSPQVAWYLKKALETDDPTYLVKLYTAATGFCEALNELIANQRDPPGYKECNVEFGKFWKYIGIFGGHKSLWKRKYLGVCYRGMRLSHQDYKKNYDRNVRFLIKPFTSTSKNRKVAQTFAQAPSENSRPLSVLLIFNITDEIEGEYYRETEDSPTALDIASISEYPDEEEVLILPYTAFRIQDINEDNSSGLIEIQLENY